jgi:hypothetical protein
LERKNQWAQWLPLVEWWYNTSYNVQAILCTLKENLVMNHNGMKKQVDQGHSECQFVEGDQVFIQLQPYKQNYFKADHCQKLAPKFYGPYTVLKCVRQAKLDEEGSIWLHLHAVLDQHEFLLRQRTIKEVLV